MIRSLILLAAASVFISSCSVSGPGVMNYNGGDTLVAQSLFTDHTATITEEHIKQVLDGHYNLPEKLRVAIVLVDNAPSARYRWNEENHVKTRQAYLDLFTSCFSKSARVTKVAAIPSLLVDGRPTYQQVREAAVRMQADIVVLYSITSDVYSKYKFLAKADMKAFATTQLMIMDVRTGLIPFTAISTKDHTSQKQKEELNQTEAQNRIKNEAVLLTINDIGVRIGEFLGSK